MTESTSKKKTGFWLSSMVFAIALMLLLSLFMLAGVLPTPGGTQSTVFQTPVFIFLLILLVLSSGTCALKRKFSLRSMGFHITHLSVVILAAGATIGLVKEERATVQLFVDERHPVFQVQTQDEKLIDLGFSIVAKNFHVERYLPDLRLYHKNELVRKIRITEGQTINLEPGGTLTVEKIIQNAKVTNCNLSGPRELVIYNNGAEWKRINLETLASDIPLPGQSIMKIIRIYNNVPQMRRGETFQETIIPVRPGIIAEITEGKKRVVISLVENEGPQLLSPVNPEELPDVPSMMFVHPPVNDISIISVPEESSISAVNLKDPSGRINTLLQKNGPLSFLAMEDEWILEISEPSDKFYKAQINVIEENGDVIKKEMTVNKPVDHKGWRFYLNSYDQDKQSYMILTARRDPGDKLAVTGIIALIIGISLIFYVRPIRKKKI